MAADNPNANRGPWCVGCGTEKGGTNHWFKIVYEPQAITVTELDDPRPGDPVCGEACATKKVSEWMSARTAKEPPKV